ncbi:helix-turn-helix transcriptional regulator [Streptomyces antibioticus]|uniref:helix-turn-helix transcriptional regulator n=1 Tax=Streptomyces antibioticus TaxID=1890 RepID=UPI0036DE38DC
MSPSREAEPLQPVQAIARRVKEIRLRRGLTAKQLGELLTARGIPWDRFTVANLENGKRQNVSVTELLALGDVLNVAPVDLLVPPERRPIDEQDPYQVTPDRAYGRWEVRQWVRGIQPLPGADAEEFHAEGPPGEYGQTWLLIPAKSAVDIGLIASEEDDGKRL